MVKNNFRNQQKIKDEQINFLLGELEKSLEQYIESLDHKDKQLSEAKRILGVPKQNFEKLGQENRDLKTYIQKIKEQFQQQNHQQQLEFLKQQKATYNNSRTKKYKKVVFAEESESENEPEFEEEQNSEIEELEQEAKPKNPKEKTTNHQTFLSI